MISMYTHQCCSRSTLDIAGTLLALSYIFCVYRLGCWENPPPLPQGGGTIWLGEGGVWGSLLTYTYIIYIDTCSINYPIIYSTSDSLTKSFFWYLNQHFSSFLMVTYRQTIIFLGKWLNSTKTQCFFCETQHFRTNLMLKSVKSH